MRRVVPLAALAAALCLSPAHAAAPVTVRKVQPARADSVKAKVTPARPAATRTATAVPARRTTVAAATPPPRPVARTPVGTAGRAPVRAPAPRRGILDGIAIEPLASVSRDSDRNRTLGTGFLADLPVRRALRVGISAVRTKVADDFASGLVDDGRLRATLRPRKTWRLEASAGAARLAPPTGGASFRWVGGLRTRWRAAGGRPSGEFRLERAPLLANPILLGNIAMRSDGRLALELPVRKLRLRGAVRGARIESAHERNYRGQADAAIALPYSRSITPFLQYRSLGYRHPATTGYFAPHRVEAVETGSSFEYGSGAPWLLSVEVGAGIQRMQAFGAPLGGWRQALRGYGYLSYAAGAGCELRLEAENENSPGLATSASEDWRYHSLSFALRWALP